VLMCIQFAPQGLVSGIEKTVCPHLSRCWFKYSVQGLSEPAFSPCLGNEIVDLNFVPVGVSLGFLVALLIELPDRVILRSLLVVLGRRIEPNMLEKKLLVIVVFSCLGGVRTGFR